MTEDERLSVADFMRELQTEPHLIPQLMSQALDLFNAGVSERPGVRYGSVAGSCTWRPPTTWM